MKKLFIVLFICVLSVGGYAQSDVFPIDEVVEIPAKKGEDFKFLLKFKPLTSIVGLAFNMFDFQIAFVPYPLPKIGIPIDLEITYFEGYGGVALMSGIEAVPFTHREKSGFYLNYELGGMFLGALGSGFCTQGHIGYQLVTKRAFALTTAVGVMYDTVTEEVRPHLMIDIGFGIRKK